MSSADLIREAHDPATALARLAELASADRATWPALAANPSTYDALLGWLAERNDPAVDAALAARTQAAVPPVTPAPAAPSAADETPTVVAATAATAVDVAAQPEATSAPEQTATFASPVAESIEPAELAELAEPTGDTGAPLSASGDSTDDGRNIAVVIAMVAVVIALIAGAVYGATQVFGADDDPATTSPIRTEKSAAASTDSAASADFCATMKSVEKVSQKLVSGSSTAPDVDDLKAMGEKMADAYDELATSAPRQLRADVQAMGGYFELMTDPTQDTVDKMTEDFTDYMESAQKVGAYYAQNCF